MDEIFHQNKKFMLDMKVVEENINALLLSDVMGGQGCTHMKNFNAFYATTYQIMKRISDHNMTVLEIIQNEQQQLQKTKAQYKHSNQKIAKLKSDREALKRALMQEQNEKQILKRKLEQEIVRLNNNLKDIQYTKSKNEPIKPTQVASEDQLQKCKLQMWELSRDFAELKIINKKLVNEILHLELLNKNLKLKFKKVSLQLEKMLENENRKRNYLNNAVVNLLKIQKDNTLSEQLESLREKTKETAVIKENAVEPENAN